jgi:hypothetical protein
MENEEKITYFGETDFRNRRSKFGIKNIDRSRHVYIIGKTGMGKSTVLENMAAQDILNGEGMCFIDPHGSAIDVLIDYIPPHRVKDVVYFAPFDTDYPMSFNVFESVEPDKRHFVVSGLIASFKKIWPDSFSARMEYILANTLLALLEYPKATLLGVNRMLAEKDFRDDVIKHVTDNSVRAFWIDEYNKWDPRYAREAGAAIQNKIGQFTGNPLIRNIVGQTRSSMDFRDIMDAKKILLVNLSKGLIGESNGNLLGGMLITKLYIAAMSRADVGAGNLKNLPDFFFFVDEFQNFANESFADILSEARKYKLNLTVAHQYVEQMQEEVASAIFGNVGTMITFRIGATDAEIFEKQFSPIFTAEDIVNLGKFQIYLSLMIDGIGSRPFSARTMAPIPKTPTSMRPQVIEYSRSNYAEPRGIVESNISTWFEPIKKAERRTFDDINKSNPKGVNQKNSFDNKKTTKPHGKTQDEKQTFVAPKTQRDTDSPAKKALKEFDEKEAEIEMKQIVSPKLSHLLDKIGFKEKNNEPQKNVTRVIENIRKRDNGSQPLEKTGNIHISKTKIPESVTQKAATIISKKGIDRGVKKETLSSLQAVLQKAINSTSSNKIIEKKQIKQNKYNTQRPINVSSGDTDTLVSSKVQHQEKDSLNKEVPEDILRSIFN